MPLTWFALYVCVFCKRISVLCCLFYYCVCVELHTDLEHHSTCSRPRVAAALEKTPTTKCNCHFNTLTYLIDSISRNMICNLLVVLAGCRMKKERQSSTTNEYVCRDARFPDVTVKKKKTNAPWAIQSNASVHYGIIWYACVHRCMTGERHIYPCMRLYAIQMKSNRIIMRCACVI